jgi:GNAT superfamily N-acetyltransferase
VQADNETVVEFRIRSGDPADLLAVAGVFRKASLSNAGDAAALRVGQVLELEDLFVDPDWMRCGIGRRLVRDIVAIAERRRVPRVEVTARRSS